MQEISIRQTTVDDIPDLVRLRRLMFESMGYDDPAQLDAASRAAGAYFNKAIPKGEFYGWLAVTQAGEAVGSGGAVIDQHPQVPCTCEVPGTWLVRAPKRSSDIDYLYQVRKLCASGSCDIVSSVTQTDVGLCPSPLAQERSTR